MVKLNTIDLNDVGVHVLNGKNTIHVSVPLPGITPATIPGCVFVKIISKQDTFVQDVKAIEFELSWRNDNSKLDIWEKEISLDKLPPSENGEYLYQFILEYTKVNDSNNKQRNYFNDPFARRSGPGLFSAFTTKFSTTFNWNDNEFRVPNIRDTVVYELMVDEFNGTFDGAIERLDYITQLGVNVIELMPVTNIIATFQWGYEPLNYFAPEERFGGPEGLKKFVQACHSRGIAVIHDVVYNHVHKEFSYVRAYRGLDRVNPAITNPIIGKFVKEFAGLPDIDFTKEFARNFIAKVNEYWLDEFHMDGFRYDCVPAYYDGCVGIGYANLVSNTYNYTIINKISRFIARDKECEYSSIIQTAEHLDFPQEMLTKTYSNSCWQDGLLNNAKNLANTIHYNNKNNFANDVEKLIQQAILYFVEPSYPLEYKNTTTGVCFPVSPFQYIESHDHSNLLYILQQGEPNRNLPEAGFDVEQWDSNFDLNKCYKLQPFAIALMTCEGTPMIRQGQEFGETYGVPGSGMVKILAKKALHWEYFYQEQGYSLVKLYRRLGKLRAQLPELRSRVSFFEKEMSNFEKGLVVYKRCAGDNAVIVIINFSDSNQAITFSFPSAGVWTECIDEKNQIKYTDSPVTITINSNYGAIYKKET